MTSADKLRARTAHAPCGLAAALLLLQLAVAGGASGAVATSCPDHLFVIARSKNANIVVYDANRGPSGDLVASKPVVAYWLLNGEKGKREELSFLQWKSAYGFDVKRGSTPGTFDMTFKADRNRRLTLQKLNDCPVLTGPIDGRDAIMHKMFVKSNESFTPPKVEYIELFGKDIATGKRVYEKSVPAKG